MADRAETDLVRVAAGRAAIDALHPLEGPRRAGAVNALGAETFGDGRLDRLVTCSVCGVLGDPGDLCGRQPDGHRLVAR